MACLALNSLSSVTRSICSSAAARSRLSVMSREYEKVAAQRAIPQPILCFLPAGSPTGTVRADALHQAALLQVDSRR